MTKQEQNQWVRKIVEDLLEQYSEESLRKSSLALRTRYRDNETGEQDFAVRNEAEALGYLAWRYPATTTVIRGVLERLIEAAPEFEPLRVLDLGAGPAASLLPLVGAFPEIQEICFVEEQQAMRAVGETVIRNVSPILPDAMNVQWIEGSFLTADLPRADLILSSYALNELSLEEICQFCEQLKRCAQHTVILIVPGTPPHFQKLLTARHKLLEAGFTILAPCTFSGLCNMEDETDWCHFYERVQRSSLLRRLKSAELAYEDEKFSYLILERDGKNRNDPELGRILRHPVIHKGRREVTVCHQSGITMLGITKKKHAQIYRELRGKGWGDVLHLPVLKEEGEKDVSKGSHPADTEKE